jgi:hypothetical protein
MSDSQEKSQPSRRGFMLGAAVAGAATAAVVALPKGEDAEVAATEKNPPAPANGGGYRLSEHVKHYYRTTLI